MKQILVVVILVIGEIIGLVSTLGRVFDPYKRKAPVLFSTPDKSINLLRVGYQLKNKP